MRNLKIVKDAVQSVNSHLPLTASTWDLKNDSVIFTLGPSISHETIEVRRAFSTAYSSNVECQLLAAWDAPCPVPDLAVDNVVDLHYCPETATVCLVLAGGDIIQVREEPLQHQSKIEIVGSVDAGIAAAAWSPDEELLAVATRADTLLFMTIDFESIATVSLTDEDAKLSKHVSVGWGKVETQFKGKRAKALRDPTMPERVDEGVLSPFDQHDVTISWRGDGSFVAMNSIVGGDVHRRMIRIFNREGALESVTEPVDGLEGALSWRPAGNLITAVQRLDHEVNIIFFERNGLRHGSFSLRLGTDEENQTTSPILLIWNVLSSVLAVSFRNKVQLWTMGNYHYYMKQEIQCIPGEQCSEALVLTWHPEDPLRMVTLSPQNKKTQTNGDLADTSMSKQPRNIVRCLHLIFTVSSGPLNSPNDFGMVAVIDGHSLKITPFRKANVPPPMALHEVQVQPVKDVAINSSNALIAALHEDSFSIVQMNAKSSPARPSVARTVKITKLDSQITCQICFAGEENIFIMLNDFLTGATSIYDVSRSKIHMVSEVPTMSCLTPSLNHESLCLQDGNSVDELHFPAFGEGDSSIKSFRKTSICHFPSSMSISKFEVLHHNGGVMAFGLSTNGALYANERLLVNGCTSFLVTKSYIIFTTSNHLLKFVHLTNLPDLEVPLDEPELDERCRNVERGAKLVTVMPTKFSLVLQMPRGNLETIYPRALVLESIRSSIAAREYRKAFLTCRAQRVDMNILHDYAPKQFLADVGLFVDQLQKVEYIDLFLAQLRNEDVSRIMYKQTLPQSNDNRDIASPNDKDKLGGPQAKQIHTASKINDVCDAFLSVLKDKFNTNLQNVITAHVCKLPPNIEGGLQVIASLKEQEAELAERAIEHVCFLVDVNRVYESALGLYDLSLALLVAQQSQKDPREYLPYLQSLQELPALRKQFTIDHDLGRHVKALNHLRAMKDFEEVKDYTKKHVLYREALDLYRYESDALGALTKIYADFLSTQSSFKDAAIAYESLKDYASACAAYRAANLWEESLSSAYLVPMAPHEIESLAQSFADHLSTTKDFHACALVHLDYLSDLPAAISNFCKAHRFQTAIRLASLHQRPELLAGIVDPGLVEASATLTDLLAECKTQMNAQVPRLRELREVKAANPLAFLSGDAVSGANTDRDIPDDISLAPSANSTAGGASLFTRYTQRSGLTNTIATGASRQTSKNRRREERKRARGKKGSVYEEEYLVNSVGRLIERVNESGGDVKNTIEGLMRRNMRERARAVEEAMVEIVGICKAVVSEVFEEGKEQNHSLQQQEEGNDRPPGAEGVLWDSLEEGKTARVVPIIKPYERSTFWA